MQSSMVVSAGISVAALMCVFALCLLAGHVLIAVAVYNDARSKSNRDAVMWALLVGFLGLIPGIIYLCIRNDVKNYVICPQCGLSHLVVDPACPRCGANNPYYAQAVNPMAGQQAHQAKTELIIGIILFAVGIVGMIVAVANFMFLVVRNSGAEIYIH